MIDGWMEKLKNLQVPSDRHRNSSIHIIVGCRFGLLVSGLEAFAFGGNPSAVANKLLTVQS